MDSNAIPIGENTKVIVKSSGDLFLQGGDQAEVRFQSSEDRIRVHHANETIYIETHADMDLSVPRGVSVLVEKVGGSAFVQDLESGFSIQKIGGDLALRRVSSVNLEKIGGSCWIEDVSGGLQINKIGGDLYLRQAVGPVSINTIGGEGSLQITGESPLTARSGGDIRIYITEMTAASVSVRAGGEVNFYLPSQASATLNLTSDGETIDLRLGGQTQRLETRHYDLVLGEGGAPIEARAGGDIHISDETQEPDSISEDLNRRESAWLEARERHGHASWTGGFGFDRSSAWADMISRRAQEAARRAEQRAQAAVRRTEDQIRMAAEREMRRSESRWGGFGVPPVPPVPPSAPAPQPVTEQERLLVLQMLQEQKISVEQAEKLLAALEGRFER